MSDKPDWLDEITEADRINADLRDRIAELERENAELRLAANLTPTGKITTLVGIEPSRLRELELYKRRWETVERLASTQRERWTEEWMWAMPTLNVDFHDTFAVAVDNASTEDTTNAK